MFCAVSPFVGFMTSTISSTLRTTSKSEFGFRIHTVSLTLQLKISLNDHCDTELANIDTHDRGRVMPSSRW